MPRLTCPHCEREFEMEKPGPCLGCAELGHTGANVKRCAACKADGHGLPPAAEKPVKRPVKRPRAETKGIDPVSAPGVAIGQATNRTTTNRASLVSTLRGLATIAKTPYGQKAAEDMLLAYLGDPEIDAAYEPFRRPSA